VRQEDRIDQSDRRMTSPRRRHALYWEMSLPENRSIHGTRVPIRL
jgi:hypothetical protein